MGLEFEKRLRWLQNIFYLTVLSYFVTWQQDEYKLKELSDMQYDISAWNLFLKVHFFSMNSWLHWLKFCGPGSWDFFWKNSFVGGFLRKKKSCKGFLIIKEYFPQRSLFPKNNLFQKWVFFQKRVKYSTNTCLTFFEKDSFFGR